MQAAKPTVRNGYIVRTGRGYSFEELKEAGIDPRIARRRGVPVDVWRQTKHPDNVEQLKSISKTIEPRKAATRKEEKTAKKPKKE
ncbi:MAG TPA: ribosomal protein L13e [Nitrososphaera sp.]|nr:ribosomal protein L13e [Nitrososphaera sp.]